MFLFNTMSEPQKAVVSTTENLDITFTSGENVSITKTKHCVTLNLQLDDSNKNSYSGKHTEFCSAFFALIACYNTRSDAHANEIHKKL